MFKNLTIKSRVGLVVGLLSLLLVSVGILGISGLSQSNDAFKGAFLWVIWD